MADPYVPIFRAVSVTSAGASITFSAAGRMGAAYIRNAGPDEVFLGWEAIPGSATVGDGRLRLMADEAINLDAIKVLLIGFRTAVGDTAVVEVTGLPRSGSSGVGIS